MNDLLLEFLGNILTEAPSKASEEARQLGLEKKPGFGLYGPPGKDVVTHRSAGGKLVTVGEQPPTDTKQTSPQKVPVITKKSKALARINSVSTKEFSKGLEPSDKEFEKYNKGFRIGPPPSPYKFPLAVAGGAKIPTRHIKTLERMINTRVSPETIKLSHFTTQAGAAGQISAQAGELMTLIGSTLSDKDAQTFFNSLLQHEQLQIAANPALKNEASRIVTKSWITAAEGNRQAILKRINKQYPNAKIVAGAWDSEGEVTALGLSNYKQNKGFSTDVYFKIKTRDGKEILDEVSLKKSTKVNFLNSGTGKLLEWDKNIPDNINPKIYSDNERKLLLGFGSKNLKELQKIVNSSKEVQAVIKSKKITLEEALDKLAKNKGSRGVNKVILAAIKGWADSGSKKAQAYLQTMDNIHKTHQKNVITALGTNPKLKSGMLTAIKDEFPLKAIGEGEESMAIGNLSLDTQVMKAIFDTSDFNEIKEGLFAVTNEEPPYLAYRAGKRGRIVPIATIEVREDGVGYGGQIKFDMRLDARFAQILKSANKSVYGN